MTVLFCTLFAATAFAYPVDQCAADRFGSNLNCTAGDVAITGIAIAPGSPTKCVGGSTYTVDLDVTVNFATPDRWDVGIFLSNDGNDPQDLSSGGGAATCSVGILPLTSPFLDLDSDGCGDGNGAINGGTGSGVVRLSSVPVACEATNLSNGNLFVPFVVSWDNKASPSGLTCSSIADPVPNTKSKCNAPDGTVATEVQYGTIETVVLPEITKNDGLSTITAGDSTTYSVVITNTTGAPISDVIFKDPAVPDLTVNSLGCSASGGASCPASYPIAVVQGGGVLLPTMPVGSSVTFTIGATVNADATAGTITNTAYATVRTEENTASDTNNVINKIDASKTFVPNSINAGDTSVLTITLDNPNVNQATNLAFSDTYPANLVNTATPGVTNTCGGTVTATAGGGSLSLSGGTLAAGSSCTITVNVTSAVSAAFTNTTSAISSDLYVGDPATGVLAVGVPNLETSTKTFVDLNGGEVDPGDTLRYTITLNETAGVAANSVTVTDSIPAALVNPAVVSCPTGATCNIAGQTLTASNVTVPASGSVSIVFDVLVPVGTAQGSTINNCFTATAPIGIGASSCAPTVTVSPSAVAQTGNKWLYLDSATTMSRTAPTGTPAAASVSSGATQTFSLIPVLQQDVTISPTVTPLAMIPVFLNLSSDVANSTRQAQVTVSCTGGGPTYSQTKTFDGTALNDPYLSTTPNLVFFDNLPFSADHTCSAGSTWQLSVNNVGSGNIIVSPVSGGNNSYISLPSISVINVDSVTSYNAGYPATTTPADGVYYAGDTVYVRAVISDPYGSYDISSATVTITDPDGTDFVVDAAMSEVNDSGLATKTFEYSYLVPTGEAPGAWTAVVTANEGAEGMVTDTGTGSFTVAVPDLSTSTKTVVDLNGGDVELGDTLRYTITLIESAGDDATNVQVTDDILNNINTLSVVSIPAGSTDNSTGNGTGANGNGFLDITGISIPASGTETIVYDVQVTGPNGGLIDNTATISNPNGTDGTATAPTLIIAGSAVPASGTKQLYFQAPGGASFSTPESLSRIPLTAYPANIRGSISRSATPVRWDLTPALQTDLDLNANSVLVLQMDDAGSSNLHHLRFTLSYDPGTGPVQIVQQDFINIDISDFLPATYTFNLTHAAVSSIPAGSVIQLTIDNEPDDAGGDTIYIAPYSEFVAPADTSRVELNSATVVNVDSIDLFTDVAYPGGSTVTSVSPGDTIRIRSTVSDPFGSFDIAGATITITDSDGTDQVIAAAMTEVHDSGAATKVYEYQYSVPGAGPTGDWTIRVDATEGTEGVVSDYGLATMTVASSPNLTFLKLQSVVEDPVNGTVNPQRIPGADIVYTLRITNFGSGAAENLVFTDPVPANTKLFVGDLDGAGPQTLPVTFTDGAVSSGFVAADVGVTYSSTADCTDYSYNPIPTADPDEYNTDVCRLRVMMNSAKTLPGSNASFDLDFKVRIE